MSFAEIVTPEEFARIREGGVARTREGDVVSGDTGYDEWYDLGKYTFLPELAFLRLNGDLKNMGFAVASDVPARRRVFPGTPDVQVPCAHREKEVLTLPDGRTLTVPEGDWHWPIEYTPVAPYKYIALPMYSQGVADLRNQWAQIVRNATVKYLHDAVRAHPDWDHPRTPEMDEVFVSDGPLGGIDDPNHWTNIAGTLDTVGSFPEFQYNLVRLAESKEGSTLLHDLKFPFGSFEFLKPSPA